MDSYPKSEVVRLRISSHLKDALPTTKGKRSAFIRKAINHFLDTRQGANKYPIPHEAELQAMLRLVRELNSIGGNLNQAVMMLHLTEQGRGEPPTAEEVCILHQQLSNCARRITTVVRYWYAP